MGVIGSEAAAKKLGVSPPRIRAMIASGILKATKIGRDWLIDEADIEVLKAKPRPAGRPRKK